jgi:hypothetical protein
MATTTPTKRGKTMTKITLRNDFHNTEVNVVLKGDTLTRNQMYRVKKALCGRDNCACGPIRGPQGFEYEYDYVSGSYGSGAYETIRVINVNPDNSWM